jgi:hypothetical protein
VSTDIIESSAEISTDGVYRYRLLRRWHEGPEVLRWIMLNPSTADASLDDPTIRRCMGFARDWGYAGIVVQNLYALRATDPRGLRGHPDPVGPVNDSYIAGWRVPTICAWGNHADDGRPGRATEVLALLHKCGVEPMCLGRTKGGHPKHPLYLPKTAAPFRLEARTAA